MSKQKFKEGDNILVTKGIHKGMIGTISGVYKGGNRVRYRVTFKSFITYMNSYQMRLYGVRQETNAVKSEKSGVEQGAHVMLSKQGLAKIHMDGILKAGHSYEWVLDNNYHTIDRVDTIDGINFYALTGFAKYYYFTIDDLIQIPAGYDIGDMVQFTRESLVRLGAVLSEYCQDDTININKLLQDITGPHKVIYIQHLDGELVYRLSGECFGKLFYEREIEPVNK